MSWVTTKDGRRVNTDWFKKAEDMVENDYRKDAGYRMTMQELSALQDEKEKVVSEWLAKDKELDKEVVKIPPLGFAESKALGSFTEKGEKLAQEVKELRKKRDELEAKIHPLERAIEKMESDSKERELGKWRDENHQFSPRTKQEYEGFKQKTGIPAFDEAVERGDARIVEMSPKEYMQRVSYDIFGSSLSRTMNGVNLELASQYAQEMQAGSQAPMPYLDYDGLLRLGAAQEGRHRAIAAYLNGYDKIPVAVYKKPRK